MRFGRRRPAAPPEPPPRSDKPPWQDLIDPQERPNREDRAAYHSAIESMLEPVPMPRWLRGRRRAPSDKLS
jgi:hypothetical protein